MKGVTMASTHATIVASDDQRLLDARRLEAIRQVFDDLWIAQHHSARCATTAGMDEVRHEAVEEIRAITDSAWRPPAPLAGTFWRRPRLGA